MTKLIWWCSCGPCTCSSAFPSCRQHRIPMHASMVAGLGLQLQHQLQSLPRCCIPHQQQQQRPRCMPARYQPSSRDLEQLFQEAQQGPQVTGWPPTQQHQHSPSSSPTRLPDMRLRPSQMDFPTMYTQLQAWQARHLSAHVPHHCFDAPELGAWVRHMRKQRKDGRLEQWKVDSLSVLGFEWELTNQAAKWHHFYHQLRRYRSLYGTTDIDTAHSEQDGCDWGVVAWWLQRQARLLAKQRLGSQQRAMLEQLGVRLAVPKQLVQRTAQLQALNGPERRQLRKKWKLQDNMAREAQRQQRHQELRELLQQRREQRQLEQQRERVLRRAAAAAAAADDTAGIPGGQQAAAGGRQSQQQLVSIAMQQLQAVQQLSLHKQAPSLLPQGPASAAAHTPPPMQPQEQALSRQSVRPAAATAGGGGGEQQPAPAAAAKQAVGADGAAAPQQQHLQQDRSTDQQKQGHRQQHQEQQEHQQGQQAPRTEAGALLFQPNRRRKKVGKLSRQEKWLAAADGWQQQDVS